MGTSDSEPKVVGRYALYGEIASGGMATVHYGRLVGPVGFSRTVAIKRLHPQFAKDPDFSAMFLDEARLAARIRHPNVVPTLDVVQLDGELFLVMDYVQGESLFRLLRACIGKGATVPLDVASGILCGTLHGLHAAHEATNEQGEPLGIVHRDVSPQNILVGADGAPRVLDFGVAKAAGRVQSTRDGQLKGKLSYMSPEQIRSQPIDRRTDIYAMGVVLWETLTLERLFFADTEGATVQRILDGVTLAPSQVAKGVPSAVDAIALRALAQDPKKRFETSREMALALEAAAPPATAARTADWLEGLSGDILAERARSVADIESRSDVKRSFDRNAETLVAPTSSNADSAPRQPTSVPRSRVWAWVTALALASAIIAVVLTRRGTAGDNQTETGDAAPRVVTLTDLPLPASANPAALGALRAAMQSLRDGNEQEEQRLSEAIKADPSLAGAELRLSLRLILRSTAEARVHYARAQQMRDSMSEHDRVLLDVVEPYVQRDPEDAPEFERRTQAAHDRFPLDAEFAEWAILARDGYASTEKQLEAVGDLLNLDPKFGYAYFLRAYYQAYDGDFEGVRRTASACIAAVPSADRCLLWLIEVEQQIGPPERLEADARRFLAVSPLAGHYLLAEALLARGRPLLTVREAVDQNARASPQTVHESGDEGHYALDVLAGDFESAERRAQQALADLEGEPTRAQHAVAVRRMVELLREEGEEARAADLARSYLLRKDIWAPDPRREDYAIARDPTPFMESVVVHAGKAPPDELARVRRSWLDGWKPVVRPFYASYLWPHAYASTVETPEEAREAVAALDPAERIPPFWQITFLGGDIGRTLFLAGRNEEALRWLRESAGCSLALDFPVEHTRANYWLGRALEVARDVPGACLAYRRVLDRWATAKPRSVTAARASERARSLTCPSARDE